MSAQNKALLIIVAIVAFVIGATLNKARISDQTESNVLLNAQLIVVDPTSPDIENTLTGSINDSIGKLTLVNFWASWCAPCRDEMPIFETMYRQSKELGFVVIGVAIDSPNKAQPMLDSMDITYPILYAEQSGMEIMASTGNPQGLLPYSLLLDEDGVIIEQVLGKIDEQQIAIWLTKHL